MIRIEEAELPGGWIEDVPNHKCLAKRNNDGEAKTSARAKYSQTVRQDRCQDLPDWSEGTAKRL